MFTAQPTSVKELVDNYISANLDMLTDLTKSMKQVCLDKQYTQALQELTDKLDTQPTDQLDLLRQLQNCRLSIEQADISENTTPFVLASCVRQAVLYILTNIPFVGRHVMAKHTPATVLAAFKSLAADEQVAAMSAIKHYKSTN